MLTGVAPTQDEGIVRIRIDYEDENGAPAEPVEKELTLLVTEEQEMDWGMEMDADAASIEPEEPSFWQKNKKIVIGAAVIIAVGAAAVIPAIWKKRRAAKREEEDDEIS